MICIRSMNDETFLISYALYMVEGQTREEIIKMCLILFDDCTSSFRHWLLFGVLFVET